MREKKRLEFSCHSLELSVNQGEMIQDSFIIYAGSVDAKGEIYSSDTRMKLVESQFCGEEAVIEYCFDGSCMEAGGVVKGQFTIISNYGEYTLDYHIQVQKPILEGSLGTVKNLFHFTNLARTNWDEALELFYAPEFIHIFQKNEKKLIAAYTGLSRFVGNSANMEEFLVESNKKTQIQYQIDIEGFSMEDVFDNIEKTITISKEGWGYTELQVMVQGEFISTQEQRLFSDDFVAGVCHLDFTVDATKLRSGKNEGKIIICDTRTRLEIPVTVMMTRGNAKLARMKEVRRLTLEQLQNYIDLKFQRISLDVWAKKAEQNIEELLDMIPNNLLQKLNQVQILLTRERFQEAKWYLDQLDEEILQEDVDSVARCYYFYLTTFFNRDESYVRNVLDEIENARASNPKEWHYTWLLFHMEDDDARSAEVKWQLLEEQFENGCTSPVLLCEAVLLLDASPTLLRKLGHFEQNVLWYAAKNKMLQGDAIEQLQYLLARYDVFSILLFKTLSEVYQETKSSQTVSAICRMLILGKKVGAEYFQWYALGVEYEVRVIRLYEYYMMSIPLDYDGELPKMVLMYFAYQSSLDYERNAFLYAYVIRNRESLPDLEQNYHIAIERFVVDQIKLGHMNENLAYLYQNILAPQMLRDETTYAFTPLLFTHRIYIENPNITSVVVLHDKINGESIYPVENHVCMLPIYGEEYLLLLQDAEGNRFTQSIAYENKQLMEPEKLLPFIGSYMEGRLSFDIYQCQLDKGYITITTENEKRFKGLSESEQVIDEFKKEIRTNLLHYYYDNDMIGELDAFLEDIEPNAMESAERAEFIRFMISRGMFEKAYQWLRCYGLAGTNNKAIARLVSRRVVACGFQEDEFLVNVAYYIFTHARYDENILKYLILHFKGRMTQLRNIWKAAIDLEMDTGKIMHRMLKQMRFTNTFIPEKDELLLAYSKEPERDEKLMEECLKDAAYEYFVMDYMADTYMFDILYERYRQTGEIDLIFRLALLKYWAEDRKNCKHVMPETIITFVEDLLQKNIFFPFFQNLADIVPQLSYYKDKRFIEYRAEPGTNVQIHYYLDDEAVEEKTYETEPMQEMYGGIFVKAFSLFHGEVLQYYITEGTGEETCITQSNMLAGEDWQDVAQEGRFFRINDILLSLAMQDTETAGKMMEEYMQQDYCARELFRVI